MKPNFALSLSFDGIKLLHRAAGGWREIGEVAVSSDDLAGELAILRKTATSLEPGGLRTKLVIPESQIKYLTIDTPDMSDADRRKAAELALVDATPYTLPELAYDISIDGAQTHIAAVARETLAEAEAFAVENRFHPVSFVAVPGDAAYLGEPFFGMTEGAQALLEPGETVEPDGIAVVIVGTVSASDIAGKAMVEEAAPSVADTPASAEPDPAEDVEATEPAVTEPEAADATPDQPKAAQEPEETAIPARQAAKSAPEADKPVTLAKTAELPPLDLAVPEQPAKTQGISASQEKAAGPEAPPEGAAPRKPTLSAAQSFSSRRSTPSVAPARPLGGAQRTGESLPAPDSSSLAPPPQMAADAAELAPVEDKRGFSGFLSRRKPRKRAAAPLPVPIPEIEPAGTEAERMTVFGARTAEVGGKPRFLGLIMTVILLVFLAGVAAWAAVFLDDGIAGLLRDDARRTTASAPENQIDPEVIRATEDAVSETEPEGVQIAALDPVLSAEDTAVLDALQNPRAEPQRPVITEQEAAARYAVTGIWPLAPVTSLSAPAMDVAPVYHGSIDAVSSASDAIALPAPETFDTDVQLAAVVSPQPFGQQTTLDAEGLIVPTPEGVIAPGGFTLVAASPPLKPPSTSTRLGVASAAVAAAVAPTSPLAGFRPRNRPIGLAERAERAQLGGVSRIELAAYRPSLRPSSIQDRAAEAAEAEEAAQAARAAEVALQEETAAAAAQAATAAAAAALAIPHPTVIAPSAAIQDATRLATAQSIRPDTRPRNFDRIVRRAERSTAPAQETRVAAAASVAPRTVQPSIPSKATVARSATVTNAINLRRVNLIGVYGKPSSRRALVRLANGRYQKVSVGDRIDGGRVSAIDTSELRYTKGGRNVVLKMP